MTRNFLIGAGILALSLGATPLQAAAPSGTTIRNVTWGGDGCPVGSATAAISGDGEALTVIFDEFYAYGGPGTSPTDWRSFCQINVDVRVPTGYSYTMANVDYRGYVGLDTRSIAELRTEYYFAGGRGPSATRTWYGPVNRNYLVTDKIGFSARAWHPCNAQRPLNIKTNLKVSGRRFFRPGEAFLGVDSLDLVITRTQYYYYWIWERRC